MKSFTEGHNLYGSLTKNTSAANLTLGDQLANDEYRHILAIRDWPFLHRLRTMTTTASTQFKELPYGVDLVESVYVTVGTTRYTPKLITSRVEWDQLNMTTYTSDIPQYAFVYNGQLGLWPTPATSSNVITINGKIKVIDLSIADLTAQSVSVTTLTTAVTGAGTTWRRGLTGLWMRIPLNSSSDTTSGDGEWYEISAVSSTTALTLVKSYNGSTVATGAATIAQMPLLPDSFHDLPWLKAIATYWYKEGQTKRADSFDKKYAEGLETLVKQYNSSITDPVLDEGNGFQFINPNLTITM